MADEKLGKMAEKHEKDAVTVNFADFPIMDDNSRDGLIEADNESDVYVVFKVKS